MARTMRSNIARWSKPQKTRPSSDRSLQLDCVKSESLVIGDQLRSGEYVPEPLHTARQLMEAGGTRSRSVSRLPTVNSVTGSKS